MNLSAPPLSRPGAAGRRAAAVPPSLVEAMPLFSGAMPLLVRPATPGVDLAAWAAGHRDRVGGWLETHRALLFRGFCIDSVEAFHAVVAATSEGDLLQYRDRSTPRNEVGAGIYVSTVYPASQSIQLHNEGTYWRRFPGKIFFCCLIAARQGGETPLADMRGVLARLQPRVRDRFRDLGVLYVRNYNDGFGLPWQEVFQTADPGEVEEYCRQQGITFEWKEGGRLTTRQIRPAIRRHPQTGEEVWFNHAAFFHISSQEPAVREAMVADLGEEGLPYNTYYGDGSPLEDEVADGIRGAYRAETVKFPWQAGDVLLLDNLTVAHGREPYEGERRVVVAMAEPQGDA